MDKYYMLCVEKTSYNGYRLFIIIVLLLLINVSIVIADMDKGNDNLEINANDLSNVLTTECPKTIINNLYHNTNVWNSILRNIATGKLEWINVAVNLKKWSDAAASEMLNLSVGEALGHAPEYVLLEATKVFKLDDICNCPDIDDDRFATYDKALQAIEQRIMALEKVDSEELVNGREYCIQKLQESKSHLRQFFGIDGNPRSGMGDSRNPRSR